MKFSFTKNPESEFFYKDSKSGGVVRVSDFFSKESSVKKMFFLFCLVSFERVKVREDWLV